MDMTLLEIPATATKSKRRGSRHDFAWTHPHRSVPKPIAAREPFTPFEIFSHDELIKALCSRVEHLGISRETVSALAGLPDGYAQKILSLNSTRRIGMQSLSGLLFALSVKLVMVVDEAALERNRSRYKPRDDAHWRSARAGHDKAELARWAAARGLTVVIGDD
jgi:hypothetical protein